MAPFGRSADAACILTDAFGDHAPELATWALRRQSPGRLLRSGATTAFAGLPVTSAGESSAATSAGRFLRSGTAALAGPPVSFAAAGESSAEAGPAISPERVSELQTQIDMLSNDFGQGMHQLETDSAAQIKLANKIDDLWKSRLDALEKQCVKMRNSLESLAELRSECVRAQTDKYGGLPYLFKEKAEDPERFYRLGRIRGCRGKTDDFSQDDLQNGKLPTTVECACEDGKMEEGCPGEYKETDHELLCSHIFSNAVKDLQVLQAFQSGGACKLTKLAELNLPLMPQSDFPKMRRQGVDAMSCAALLLAAPNIAAPRPAAPRRQARRQGFAHFLDAGRSSWPKRDAAEPRAADLYVL